MRELAALGTMSGTSMDGIDLALITTDGESIGRFGPTSYTPYGEQERAALRAAIDAATGDWESASSSDVLMAAERLVTEAHIRAIEAFRAEHPAETIDVVGFHGQTVLHAPERRLTVQLGDYGALADSTGLTVVGDMRKADVAAGGEGAPLVPVYHRALVRRSGLEGTVTVVNVGGVANFTRIAEDGSLIAADTGPGNALIDDLMRERTGQAMDTGGRTAARGQPDTARVVRWLEESWFDRPAPKSLDRQSFAHISVADLGLEDAAATLLAFTSGSIVKGIVNAGGTDRLIVVGGGSQNMELLRKLREDSEFVIETGEDNAWDSSSIEACAFGYMAVRSLSGLPLTSTGTTGVAEPQTGGIVVGPGVTGGQRPIAL